MNSRKLGSLLSLLLLAGLFVSAQTHQGTLELNIEQGNSCCTYGKTINFGNKGISFSGYAFTGDFLSTIGTSTWNCTDMYGVETGWTMVAQMAGPMTSEAGNMIPADHVQISFGGTQMVGGDCAFYDHSGVDLPLDTPVILIEKSSLLAANYGKVCALQTNDVKMKVLIDAAQAPGTYTGTIVIDLPGFMTTCAGGQEVQGTVYDSEIEGLSYIGNFGSSGTTLSGGIFTYRIGETITFSLGAMQIGSLVPALDRKVFLPEILGKERTDLTDQNVVEVARLLQGLDTDANVNNGITVSASDAAAITGTLSGNAISQKLVSLGKPVKTAEDVVSHLEQTLTTSFAETGNVGYPWAIKGGSAGADIMYHGYVDKEGNSYVAGYVLGVANFGSIQIPSSGSYDGFFVKVNSGGTVEWVNRVASAGQDWGYAVNADDSGFLYVTAYLSQTGILGTYTVPGGSMFVAKMDTGGNWLGFRTLTGIVSEAQVGVDHQGNIYVEGLFAGTINLGGNILVSSGANDIAMIKMDKNFGILWAKKIGGTLSDSVWPRPIADRQGNVYFAGNYTGTLSFEGDIKVVSGWSYDGFLLKYDAGGNLLWRKYLTGSHNDYITNLVLDRDENLYMIAGFFSQDTSFGGFSFSTSGSYDVLVSKISPAGNIYWVAKGGGPLSENPGSTTAVFDDQQNLYIGFNEYGTGVFGSHVLVSSGSSDVGISKIDTNGNWLGAWSWGGPNFEYIRGLGIGADQNLYLAGYFTTTAFFGKTSLVSSGGNDLWFKKVPYRELY